MTSLRGRNEPYEVLMVDEESPAGPVEAGVRGRPAVRVLRSERSEGKGAAMGRRMLDARSDYRLFADADGATPIVELVRLEGSLATGAQLAIGSRAVVDASLSVATRRYRVLAGRVFDRILERLGLSRVADSQGRFKACTAAAAADLFGQQRARGFDVELLLLLALAYSHCVAEVPVNWTDQASSKVGVFGNRPRRLGEVMLARLRTGRRR